MPEPFTLSCWSHLCMLCCLQCRDCCAASWHRNGTASLRRMPHPTHVYPWSNECSMFLLSHGQSSLGSKSGCTCELWELQDAVNVSIWSKICQMCGMQFCDIRWGPGKHPRTEIQQLKVIIHYYCKMLRTTLGLHLKLQEFSSNISSLLVRRENFLAPSHV